MSAFIRWSGIGVCAALAALAGAAPPALPAVWAVERSAPAVSQEDDGVYVDVIRKDFLDRVARYLETKDWKGLFHAYEEAYKPRLIQKLVQSDPAKPKWISLTEHLNRLFADLPKEALEYYRGVHDGPARLEYQRARESGDRAALRRFVDEYFFSTVADEALDLLGNLYFEEGRLQEAAFYWRRLLETYPDSDIPPHLTAARLAFAAEQWRNEVALNWLRQHIESRTIDGPIRVGDRETTLARLVSEIRIEPRGPDGSAAEKTPDVRDGGGRQGRAVTGVRNEIKRWTYDFSGDVRREVIRGRARRPVPAQRTVQSQDFPYVPAATRLDGRDYVLFSNGSRVLAVDPSKVGSSPSHPNEGVYWRFPEGEPVRVKVPPNQMAGTMPYGRPFIGVTIDGEHAFATLYTERPLRETNVAGIPDYFLGTQRLVCLNIRNQKVVWDTDLESWWNVAREMKLEFLDRNFSFCSPPVVVDDRLYVGLCTSPMGEQDSRVLCLDRRTGRPIWERFLASVTSAGRGPWGFGVASSSVTYLTMIVADRGVVYAHTNLGVMAALNAFTGSVLWMSKYPRVSGRSRGMFGQFEANPFIRYASPLVLHRGRIYALPQDQYELQVFDMATGDAVKLTVPISDHKPFKWQNIVRMIGEYRDMLVLGGGGNMYGMESMVMRLTDSPQKDEGGEPRFPAGTWHRLVESNVQRSGLGTIHGGLLYLPTYTAGKSGKGTLAIFDGVTWRWVNDPREAEWQEPDEHGNLLVAGRYLVVTTADSLLLYTDVETLRAEFAARLEQSPPNPAAFLEFGDLMRANDRLNEAAEAYLHFVKAAEGDPKFARKCREIKTELYAIYLERSKMEATSASQAIEFLQTAKGFAYDDATLAEASRLLAERYEQIARDKKGTPEGEMYARKAVEEYQAVIQKSNDRLKKQEGEDVWKQAWKQASDRIRRLVEDYGAPVYESVEKAAGEMLKKAAEQAPEALREIIDLFPDSKAAVEAFQRLTDFFVEKAQWDKAASTLREFRERYPKEWTQELQKKLIEALEKLGDSRRLEEELKKMQDRFKGRRVRDGARETPVEEYVARALEAAKALRPPPPPAPRLPIRKLAEWDSLAPAANDESRSGELSAAYFPLPIQGLAPLSFGTDLALLVRGSSVELWDVRNRRVRWSAAFPVGWIGVVCGDSPDGAGARVEEILPGSPAEHAGLMKEDVIFAADGRAVDAADLEAGRSVAPGDAVRISFRRGSDERELTLAAGAWPPSRRPGVIAAAFTRDHAVAVVWETLAASFDLASGKVRWRFRGFREGCVVRQVHAVDGRLLLFERAHFDRREALPLAEAASMDHDAQTCANPLRCKLCLSRPTLSKEDGARIVCVDDETGRALWARSLEVGSKPDAGDVTFYAPYFDDFVTVVANRNQNNVQTAEIHYLSREDGADRRQRTALGNRLPGMLVDAESGRLWVIEPSMRGHVLRCVSLQPRPGPDFRAMETPLSRHFPGNVASFAMAANAEWVAVLALPAARAAMNPMRAAIFSAVTGERIATLDSCPEFQGDRALSRSLHSTPGAPFSGWVTLDAENTVYLYSETNARIAADRKAYLTAFRINAEEKKFEVAWETVVPSARPTADGLLQWVAADAHVVTVAIPHATAPGATESGPVALVLNKSEKGAVAHRFDDVVLQIHGGGAPINPVAWLGDRLFVARPKALEMYGP